MFYRNSAYVFYGNTVKILKETFGYYHINNRGVGLKLAWFKKINNQRGEGKLVSIREFVGGNPFHVTGSVVFRGYI